MSDDFWDERSGEIAELLGQGKVIQEAVPFPLGNGSIFARSGASWSMISAKQIAGADVLVIVSGLLVRVPMSMSLYADLTRRTVTYPTATLLALAAGGASEGAIVLRSVVPYQLLLTDVGPASRLARGIVSATVNAPSEMAAELRSAHQGDDFTFDDRGYLTAAVDPPLQQVG